MCRGCWEEDGSPRDLPDNAADVLDLIGQLYARPDATSGGPLHVLLDDYNTDSAEPVHHEDDTPETRDLADRIAAAMRPMTAAQRGAVIAEHWGWTRPRERPEHCPYGKTSGTRHRRPVATTHEITGETDGWITWACADHAGVIVAYQASIGNDVTATPLGDSG